ncbi:alpha/beta hydrolase [Nocardioides mangrovicus]|uniref:Alpha/beta hydrolase n=1 Tax=Nocardioides mangrovicus TaxID=2478913 RepID=A0A3L8P7Q8_9ACTN|nr:alpha/beta hydrolase [Nocardioides mangrovicus]RLV50982.1 alpha/beta hydrolase [Nocardioides mangrovicus]
MSFLLVPGAGGDPWYFHRLLPLLRETGADAVAVDLPGPDPDVGLAAYADLIAAAGRGLADVTLVAQSMAGFCAPLAADRLDVAQLVLLNAMVPRPGETAGAWWEAVGCDGPGPDFDVEQTFFHDVPADLTREAFSRGERDEAEIAFAEPWPLPAWPDVATTVLSGAEDRLFPLPLQQRVSRDRLGLEPLVVPGGHLAALSRPEELATVLRHLGSGHAGAGRLSDIF